MAIMNFCNEDISKTMTARSSQLGQLIETMSRLPGEIKKKFFQILYPQQTLFVVGYTVFTLSVGPSVRASVRNVLFS